VTEKLAGWKTQLSLGDKTGRIITEEKSRMYGLLERTKSYNRTKKGSNRFKCNIS
jgi:hypothetical protein